MKRRLSLEEAQGICPGEAITLTAVMSVLAIAIVAVVIYRMFRSAEGSITLPGGYKFSWE